MHHSVAYLEMVIKIACVKLDQRHVQILTVDLKKKELFLFTNSLYMLMKLTVLSMGYLN